MSRLSAFYIDGAWREPSGSARRAIINPATGERLGDVVLAEAGDIDMAVAAAERALPIWRATAPEERAAALQRVADGLAARAEEIAWAITREMGAPIAFSRVAQLGLPKRDIEATLDALWALKDEAVGNSLVVREPIGVVVAITPWNFPLHQIAIKAMPALAAGCTVVLKPSEVTPSAAALLCEIIDEAGLPPGVFNMVQGGAEAGATLCQHPAIDMVSFTGSTRAGVEVAVAAAKRLKKSALELGGKSANIVLDDADLATAIPAAVAQCFVNSGQVCAALSRLLVPAKFLREVEALAVDAAEAWVPGDPSETATRLGPLASEVQMRRVQTHIQGASAEGARLLCGGTERPEGVAGGFYVKPTVFSDVSNTMAIGREEVFGPVLSIMPYDDMDDAIEKANASPFGLSGGVWSSDPRRAENVARRMNTGHVCVNGAMLDVAAPFGGVKNSGQGRECGVYGLEEFTTLKTVTGLALDRRAVRARHLQSLKEDVS